MVTNAIKYANESQVQIEVQELKHDILFIVSDEGCGMSEEQQQRVFKEFEQADNSITREFGGVGLGLSIAYHLARLLGGNLTIKSKLGEGTQLTLSLPNKKS